MRLSIDIGMKNHQNKVVEVCPQSVLICNGTFSVTRHILWKNRVNYLRSVFTKSPHHNDKYTL